MSASFQILLNMASSGAVQWCRRVVQSDDHRERWLITLVTMPALWPWLPPFGLNRLTECSGKWRLSWWCMEESSTGQKGLLSRRHQSQLQCAAMPQCQLHISYLPLLLTFDEHVKCNESDQQSWCQNHVRGLALTIKQMAFSWRNGYGVFLLY